MSQESFEHSAWFTIPLFLGLPVARRQGICRYSGWNYLKAKLVQIHIC